MVEPVKKTLTPDDKDHIWRLTDPEWMHYAWMDGQWWCFPCDPRWNPLLTNKHPANGQVNGTISTRTKGFVKVP